jgi:hypothetical protein
LEDLEAFGVGAVEGEEVEEMVGDDLPGDGILVNWSIKETRDLPAK